MLQGNDEDSENIQNKPFNEVDDISEFPVDPEFWTFLERPFAQRTFPPAPRVPVALDAVEAEVVSTYDGHRVRVDVQTDAALELLLELFRGHHCKI